MEASFFLGAEFTLLEYWQWSSSDLLSNALRGKLAEFLVAKAIGAADGIRTEWDAVDVFSPSGIRIEVKCSAYIQSWTQHRPSTISFDIAPRRAWDAKANTTSPDAIRSADVYVFALLNEQDETKVDPLDLSQWEVYVISTERLAATVGNQKTIGLKPLQRLNPQVTDYHGLNEAIHSALW